MNNSSLSGAAGGAPAAAQMTLWTIPDDQEYREDYPFTKHPAYSGGHIHIFECNEDNDLYGAEFIVSILDELRIEQAGSVSGNGFHHNRQNIIRAWHEHRLFGLRVEDSWDFYEANRQRGGDDAAFLMPKSRVGAFVLPVFCVVDKPCPKGKSINQIEDVAIEYLWVAQRVRGVGVGTHMVMAAFAKGVEDPLPDAEPFWRKMGYTPQPPEPEKKRRREWEHTSDEEASEMPDTKRKI